MYKEIITGTFYLSSLTIQTSERCPSSCWNINIWTIYFIAESHVLTSCKIQHRRQASLWLLQMTGQPHHFSALLHIINACGSLHKLSQINTFTAGAGTCQNRSFMPRNRAKVCTGSRVLAAHWRLGKSQRKNGLVLFSMPINDGIVGCDRLRASLTSPKRCCNWGLSASTPIANCRFFSVYSWAHQILVLSGKFRSCPREATI